MPESAVASWVAEEDADELAPDLPANRCSTCKWWLPNDDFPGGVCEMAYNTAHLKAAPFFADNQEFFASGAGCIAHFHTGPDFGCIHHEPK